MNSYGEQKERFSIDGLVGTVLVHLVLLLCLFFFGLSTMTPPDQIQGILVNFGDSQQGSGDVQPVSAEANTAQQQQELAENQPSASSSEAAKKQTPKPIVDNKIATTDDKEAPPLPVAERKKKKDNKKVEKNKNKKDKSKKKDKKSPKDNKKKDNKKNNKDKPASSKSDAEKKDKAKPKQKEEPKPTVDPKALFPGSKTSNNSSQGNSSNSQEDFGSRMGKVDISDNSGDKSPGLGKKGVGFDLAGRRLLDIPNITDASQEVGRVVIKIKVDKNGNVIDAQYTGAGSTTSSGILKNKALAAARKAKFNSEINAAELQQGTLTFNFTVK